MHQISCKDVSYAYEGSVAVSGINCRIAAGDYLCILGHNGSGKTTFIKGILGLLKPGQGVVDFDPTLRRRDIGYLPQQNSIQKSFPASVQEVVLSGRASRLGLRPFYGRADIRTSRQALESVGLSGLEKTGFGSLSGGQQQRVLLARALCAAPDGLKVLILDEPMNSLDTTVKNELYSTLDKLNKDQKTTILMITHDVSSAVEHAGHILVLEGAQEFFGTTHEFLHTELGRSMLRDNCGNNCAVCGMGLEDI